MSEFFQAPPLLSNQYQADRVLQNYLQWKLPLAVFEEIKPDLLNLGERVISDIYELGNAAESSPPHHVPYDPWGKRIDRIEISAAWEKLGHISAEEKLIAIAYERVHGVYSRIYQFAKIYLFHPSSAIYTCPLAMTDGAARTLELHGDVALKRKNFRHLTSPHPDQFWTSGQWMTERIGGSDVSQTSTLAKLDGAQFRLYGSKWFTSATTSQMAMTLARIEGAQEGSRGLSLFCLELRDQNSVLNGIHINRLKDKLGTHALPTAELELQGTLAHLVGKPGEGIKNISTQFNITRIHNACCAVGYMRRAIALARDYANKRKAFGCLLSKHGLHVETLANLQIEYESAFHLVFHSIELLGKEELGKTTPSESAILRLLTPLVKLYTAKQAIAVVSEALEAFGGAGYIEDTGLPSLLRNVQVLSIWEGTTNVLSLDVLRAIHKENAATFFLQDIELRLNQVTIEKFIVSKHNVFRALRELKLFLEEMSKMDEEGQQIAARNFAFSLIKVYAASLLLEHSDWSFKNQVNPQVFVTAERWCARNLTQLFTPAQNYRNHSKMLGLDS